MTLVSLAKNISVLVGEQLTRRVLALLGFSLFKLEKNNFADLSSRLPTEPSIDFGDIP